MIRRFAQVLSVPLLIKVLVIGVVLSLGVRLGVAYADPTYTLSGTLTVNSVPIPNAAIQLAGGINTTSDASGNYVISSIPPGNYPLRVAYSPPNPPVGTAAPYIFTVNSVGNYLTIAGDTAKNLAFDVGTQTIHVVDSVGHVVPNANVQMAGGASVFSGANYVFTNAVDNTSFTANSMYGTVAATDANGDAMVPVPAGITYQTCVYTSVATCQSVTPVSGIASTVTIPASGTISGVITVNGQAIPGANVQISGHNVITNAAGQYAITDVTAGNHAMHVSFTPPGTPITSGIPYILSVNSASSYIYVDGDAAKDIAFNIGTQTIHVIDTDGNPVAAANVQMAGGASIFGGSNYKISDTNGALFTANSIYGTAISDTNGDALVPVAAGITYQTCVYTAVSTCHSVTPVAGPPTTFIIPSQAPVAPTGLTALSPTKAPALQWNAASGATQYKVYRDGGAVAVATVTQPSYTDTSTLSDGNHSYRVSAVNSGGESPLSNTANVVVDNTRPVVTVTPVAGSTLTGTVTFTITISDANPLDTNKNKATWVYLYNTAPPQKSVGAKVNLSNGTGTFTVDTSKLSNGNSNLDVGIVYDAAGNASGTIDNYFKNYTVAN